MARKAKNPNDKKKGPMAAWKTPEMVGNPDDGDGVVKGVKAIKIVGRPTKYHPDMCQRVLELGAQGKSKVAMGNALGLDRMTLDNWADKHPDFLSAITRAIEYAQEYWEQVGNRGIHTTAMERFSDKSWQFVLTNRFRTDYRERTEADITSGGQKITLTVSKDDEAL
jgi:transposase